MFDRKLWGRRSLWVRGSPSYVPKIEYYSDTPYKPRKADDLTKDYGYVIAEFISEAVAAGLKVYLQVLLIPQDKYLFFYLPRARLLFQLLLLTLL